MAFVVSSVAIAHAPWSLRWAVNRVGEPVEDVGDVIAQSRGCKCLRVRKLHGPR
jgi:hypothetical protein